MPTNDKAIVTQAAQKYGIDPKLLWGLYGTETSFGKNVSKSSAGAVGPFQFEPATAKGMGVNPYDFKSAAFGAARYLSQYRSRGIAGMLSAYNAGPAGGLQQGYVNTTLQNAKSYGASPGMAIRSAAPTQSAPKTIGALPRGFDQAGFQKAQKAAILGKLLASERGASSNPLLLTGLATTKAPDRSEFLTEGSKGHTIPSLPGASVPNASPPASANLHPVTPPVKVKLPSYITGKGYPAVEKAKAALEKAEHHRVSVPELSKQVDEGAKAPHAEVVAQAPNGVVVRSPQGHPIYVPHKRSR